MSDAPFLSPLELEVLAHRYLYYVKNSPVISDYEYDHLEAHAKREAPEDSIIHLAGSDLEDDYSDEVIDRAYTLRDANEDL